MHRCLRLSQILALSLATLLAAACLVVVACDLDDDQGQGVEAAAGPLMNAYYSAHPGPVDGPLSPVDSSPEQIIAQIRENLDPGQDIWLPAYLPAGFRLASPYNGNGSGSASPNPYAWSRGYSVTYTDGTGFLMVMANTDDDLSQGTWTALRETVAGRPLRLLRAPGFTLLSSEDNDGVSLLVSGGNFADAQLEAELIRVAESLRRR